jgi:prevent-host-death family protein
LGWESGFVNVAHVVLHLGMTRIGVRELRQHASRYLEKVKAGEIVEVTERGKLVALLISPSPAVAVRDQLIASGRLEPAKSEFQLPERRRVAPEKTTGSDALSDLRQERLP